VKPRFEVYKAVSQQIREIFAEHTPIIEPLSLDEAYLDVTENLQNIPLARDVALAIRARIKEVTGLNASSGISYQQVSGETRLRPSQAKWPVHHHTRDGTGVRPEPARRQIPRHRTGDEREDERAGSAHGPRHAQPVA
jgi:hypothetical protein